MSRRTRGEMTKTASEGMEAWVVARADERLRTVSTVARPAPGAQAPVHRMLRCAGDPYDTILDDYEPGTTTAEVTRGIRAAQGGARAADRRARPTRASRSR